MPRPRRRPGATSNVRIAEPPRHSLPLPRERTAGQPMAYDPASGMLVAPWPRGTLEPEDEAALVAVLDQIGAVGAALRAPVWVWPDGRAPVAIQPEGATRNWFARWGESRAVYRDRRWLGTR
jgi:hypothetical protein